MLRVLPVRFGFASLVCAAALAAGCLRTAPPAEPTNTTPGASGEPAPSAEDTAPTGTDSPVQQTVRRDGSEPGWGIVEPPEEKLTYAEVVRRVTGMVEDGSTQEQVSRRGLNLIHLTWEDTGRYQNSSVGPNISDLTLQVRYTESGDRKAALLPVIRFPNFSDRTGDVRADKFFLRVGNHRRSGELETVALRDVLKNIKGYLSDPGSVLGSGDLSAPRDSHYLVSAQAVFLPIPSQGKAEFTPVLFNYQSYPDSPAVLTLLVSRQGTSITIIENRQNQASPVTSWGQELYFNKAGERAPFSAERRTDVKTRIEAQGGPKSEDDRSALAKGADALFIIQVPLRQNARPRLPMVALGSGGGSAPVAPAPAAQPAMEMESAAAPSASAAAPSRRSDVEQAVLGHGRVEGKFDEGGRQRLVRDDRFPVRVTIQFYKATSNGVVNEADLDSIATAIGSVYEHADYVGSLVVPEGDRLRPSEWNDSGRLFPY
jgi:hypothetical protein